MRRQYNSPPFELQNWAIWSQITCVHERQHLLPHWWPCQTREASQHQRSQVQGGSKVVWRIASLLLHSWFVHLKHVDHCHRPTIPFEWEIYTLTVIKYIPQPQSRIVILRQDQWNPPWSLLRCPEQMGNNRHKDQLTIGFLLCLKARWSHKSSKSILAWHSRFEALLDLKILGRLKRLCISIFKLFPSRRILHHMTMQDCMGSKNSTYNPWASFNCCLILILLFSCFSRLWNPPCQSTWLQAVVEIDPWAPQWILWENRMRSLINEADGTMRHSPRTRMTRTIVAYSIVSTSR